MMGVLDTIIYFNPGPDPANDNSIRFYELARGKAALEYLGLQELKRSYS